jgi:MFS family permease
MFTATKLQIATYLLGVCPFSIAFLVFLNSSVSFVITDLIGAENGVGDAVGNLGFADELLALLACPVWGILSDRVGVRTVSWVRPLYSQPLTEHDVRFAS